VNAKWPERDFDKESAALLRKTTAMGAREIERAYEDLNGPDPFAAVRALAEQALRTCAAQSQEAPAQLRAAYEGTAVPPSSRRTGATPPVLHAQVHRPHPVPVASMIRMAQAEAASASAALQDAHIEYLRRAEMFEIEPGPIPHIYGPHEAMAWRCRILAWLSTATGMLGAFWLAAAAFGGPAAGALAAVALFAMMEFTVSLALGAVLETRTFFARSRALWGLCLGLLLLGILVVWAGRSATDDGAARFLEYSPLAWCAIELSLAFLGAWAFLGQRRYGWSGAVVRHYRALQERQSALLHRIEYLRRQLEGKARSSGFGEPCEVYVGATGVVYEGIRGADEDYERERSEAPQAGRRRGGGIGVSRPSWAAMYQRVAQEPASGVTRFMQSISQSLALDDFRSAWWSRIMVLLTFVTISVAIATLDWGVLSRALKLLGGAEHPPDLSVLSSGALASGLAIGVNSSGGLTDWISPDHDGGLIMRYPAGQAWGTVFITAGAALPAPRPQTDLSSYQTLLIEMRGDAGETINVGIKDATQPDDGHELRIPLQISGDWRTYTVPLKSFTGADLKKIYVLAEFVFEGTQAKTIEVRSVKFTRAAHPP
jgi:hypothetical protein